MKLLLDMSSIIWTCLQAGKDVDGVEVNHNGKTVLVNSSEYGYDNAVNSIVKCLNDLRLTPKDMVMVFEGKDSKKRRCMIDPTYKANRDGNRPPEAYVQFQAARDKLKQVFRDLGAIAVQQDFVEGDDVLGWLVANLHDDCTIMTNDGDLTVLNGNNQFGSTCLARINGEVGKNKYGDFDFKLVTLYKSTVGDSADGIKGAAGFGPAAFLNLIARYGEDGCFELEQLIVQGKRDALSQIAEDNDCKYLRRIVEHFENVAKSHRLALLHPEWVNTLRTQLTWEPGMVKSECEDERLRHWKGQSRLVTAENFGAALAFLKSKLHENDEITFDIETSTPPESDDWLEAQDNVNGVDVFGSYLVGFSFTFGRNDQYTYYVSVKHAETKNISMVQARQMMEATFAKQVVIQNTSFELAVLYEAQDEDGSLWRDHWKKFGQKGFIPKVLDTKIEASYVDENLRLGLKDRSLIHLGYAQQSYDTTTLLEGSPFPGGRLVKTITDEAGTRELRRYKMHELPAAHVQGYGSDDTICTAGLHNFYKLIMQLENTWQVYLDVEISPLYLHAKSFCVGASFNLAKMKELEKIDQATYDTAWKTLREYLLAANWHGTVPPTYSADITPKQVKEAYAIVKGLDLADDEPDEEDPEPVVEVKDPILAMRIRTPAKIVALLRSEGEDDFASMLDACYVGKHAEFTSYVQRHFTGEPKFKFSNKLMCELLYKTMGLPVRVRNKATAKMKAAGIYDGNPKADALAIAYALRDATPEQVAVLESLKLMTMVKTRMSLYYSKYPYLLHWKDGRIHSSHNQCATNTRRASSSGPNVQQLPKHPKIEGQPARFRETFVPHKKNAVIVSMDFAAQELRVIAEYSQDKNMLACFVGDTKKDMHALTGLGIMLKKEKGAIQTALAAMLLTPEQLQADISDQQYAAFMALSEGTAEQKASFKAYRSLGKKVNFTTEYGAQAPKLAATLLVDEEEAQSYIDAREDAFPEAKAWKQSVVEEAKTNGFVLTMCGARRHLTDLLNSPDRFIASKADRQAVNFKIQSSSAEMTKKAEGRMWEQDLFDRLDAEYIGPVHDECVSSVAIEDLQAFLELGHACMVQPYATMQVPILSSISFGPNFGTQIEIGELPTLEAMQAGLAEMSKLLTKE